jgi:hypothetical protein
LGGVEREFEAEAGAGSFGRVGAGCAIEAGEKIEIGCGTTPSRK